MKHLKRTRIIPQRQEEKRRQLEEKKQEKQTYDEHFKLAVRREIQQERERVNPEQDRINKFLERPWIDVRSGDKGRDTKLLEEGQENSQWVDAMYEKLLHKIEETGPITMTTPRDQAYASVLNSARQTAAAGSMDNTRD